jgi:hypothetical protein
MASPTYGIWRERDLDLDAVAANVDREALLDAQEVTLAAHNVEVNRVVGLFAERLTTPQRSVRTGVVNRLQPLDENGRPQPVKGRGNYFVGFPLWKAGTAEGFNFWTEQRMTVKDFADSLATMLTGDITWVRDQILSVLFYAGAGLSYTDDALNDSFTVYGLANGDSTVYPKKTGAAATDSHLSFQSAAIDDSHNPFPAIYADLAEHPVNNGRVVSFVPTNQIAAVEALSAFAPVNAALVNVVPAASAEQTNPLFAPGLNLPLTATMRYSGAIGSNYIVEWQSLPDDYIVSVAVDSQVKPLGMREYPDAALQGFFNQGEPMSRFPYRQNNFLRAAGFGALNRVGAHVLKIAGSYAAPSAFGFPQ